MVDGMKPVILSHYSAVRAIRYERRTRSALRWDALGKVEQRKVLAAATAAAREIDFDALGRRGVWETDALDELHLLVGSPGARSRSVPGLVCHVSSRLPAGALLRIEPELYCVTPAYVAFQLAHGMGLAGVVSLLMELMGTYALPEEATMPVAWGGVWPDGVAQDSVEQARYRCEPALAARELAAMVRQAPGSAGAGFRAAARYALSGSASPGETIMYGMFGLPMRYGGFACAGLPRGGMKLNYRLDFGTRAMLMASGMPYAVCDAYIPAAKTDLEYNGLGHEQEEARIHDGNRNNGLRGEGVRVIVINRDQMRDIEALEAIARSIYHDARVQFRYRISGYRLRQARLLNDLRQAVGLPPV